MRSLKSLRALVVGTPFYASLRVNGLQPGEHPSEFEGQGGEYLGFPDLAEGEPMSAVNWRLSARCPGRFVKTEWEAEKGIKVHILVDDSAEMGFGSQWLTMRELAAVIAGSVLASAATTGDYARVLTYNGGGITKILPASGEWHASRLVQPSMAAILKPPAIAAGSGTGLAQALRRIPHHPKALVIIISRFDKLSAEDQAALASSRKLQRVCIVVQDPRERSLQLRPVNLPWYVRWLQHLPGMLQVGGGQSLLSSGSSSSSVAVQVNRQNCSDYAQAFHEKETILHKLFAQAGCKWCTFSTAGDAQELRQSLLGAAGQIEANWLPDDLRQRILHEADSAPLSLTQCERLLNDDDYIEPLNEHLLRKRLLRVLKCQRKSGCLDERDYSKAN